jgi:deoxyribonuclease-4
VNDSQPQFDSTLEQASGTPLGMHVSMAGGLPKAVERAAERGCTALQIFCANPRGWAMKPRPDREIEDFRRARSREGIDALFVHCCYLVNLCAPDDEILGKSVHRLSAELELSAALGADGFVLHPGSAKGRSLDWCTERAGDSLLRALEDAGESVDILLETTASAHGPGGDFETLGRLVNRVGDGQSESRAGLCVDSAHVFARGYDLREAAEVSRLVDEIDGTCGESRVRLLHLNDSQVECGSDRDRHDHLGEGTIGEEGLRNFVRHPALRSVPVILETPWESPERDRQNLQFAAGLLR